MCIFTVILGRVRASASERERVRELRAVTSEEKSKRARETECVTTRGNKRYRAVSWFWSHGLN